jgi:hypothetical protein
MNITVEPTAAAGTDGDTLASGDEAFQLGCNRRCALPHAAQLAYSEA